jgi:hypothetical protein
MRMNEDRPAAAGHRKNKDLISYLTPVAFDLFDNIFTIIAS